MPFDITVSGIHLVIGEIKGNAGDEHGIASLSVPVDVPDLRTAFSLSPAAVAEAIGLGSFVLSKSRPFEQSGPRFIVTFNFEGLPGQDFPGIEDRPDQVTYEFDGEMGESPWGENPNFQALKDKYGWDKENKEFQEFLPDTDSSADSQGLSQADGIITDLGNPSPLYQSEGWEKAGATFTKTYAVATVPSSVYDGIGTIVPYPPGAENIGVPYFPGRNWLKLAPQISLRGKAILVTERHRLSGPGGYVDLAYSTAQLTT
ncbi:MAG TPA: hypothetical protein VGO11_19580 [Chthoniobacteraceae bacterium]|jgi:hypothetical protein|nr:hypothetical protein [Chthoniobacteraceae bacterium]